MSNRINHFFIALAASVVMAGVAFAQLVPPVNVTQVGGATPVAAICDDPAKILSVNINLGAGTGNSELVAIDGTEVVYVCGWTLMVGGADTTQFITGTGTACASGETDKATFNFTAAGDGDENDNAGHVDMKSAAGGAWCVERTNSVALYGRLTYVQQ